MVLGILQLNFGSVWIRTYSEIDIDFILFEIKVRCLLLGTKFFKIHVWMSFLIKGNEKLYHLLSQGSYELRMDMSDFTNQTRYVKYTHVGLTDEATKYTISLSGYSGNVGKKLCNLYLFHICFFIIFLINKFKW